MLKKAVLLLVRLYNYCRSYERDIIAEPLWGQHTKIKLWSTESIGYDDGYYECRKAQLNAQIAYLDHGDNKRFNDDFDRIERQYFGPKYIKA